MNWIATHWQEAGHRSGRIAGLALCISHDHTKG